MSLITNVSLATAHYRNRGDNAKKVLEAVDDYCCVAETLPKYSVFFFLRVYIHALEEKITLASDSPC